MGWIVVTDFDGTLTDKDVGNELSKEALGPYFYDTHGRYKKGEFGLRELQQKIWQNFPMTESLLIERSMHHGQFRPGVSEFLAKCAKQNIPVYVASCGVRQYIESVLSKLEPEARSAVHEIRCNEAEFGPTGIKRFLPPTAAADCPYPLDKGAWALEIAARHPGRKLLGIGNGTSDRSFWPRVHKLAATEGLADWCRANNVPFTAFEDFRSLLDLEIFA